MIFALVSNKHGGVFVLAQVYQRTFLFLTKATIFEHFNTHRGIIAIVNYAFRPLPSSVVYQVLSSNANGCLGLPAVGGYYIIAFDHYRYHHRSSQTCHF